MSRWVIIAGLATILISLVVLATLAGSSNQPTAGEAVQESEMPEAPGAPETPEPSTMPTTTPTSPEQETEPERTDGEQPIQGIRPSDRRASGPGPRMATIELTGDASYTCSIGRIDSPRTVRGANPTTYQVRVVPGGTSLDTVMAVCQKISGRELGVSIVYDGEVKAREDTSERLGNVSVSWSPVEE